MYGDRLPVLRALKWFACKLTTVPDPDLEIKGGGGKGRGADLRKNFFRPFGPQFGLKIRGRGSSPGSATALALNKNASALAYSDTII